MKQADDLKFYIIIKSNLIEALAVRESKGSSLSDELSYIIMYKLKKTCRFYNVKFPCINL